MQVEEKAKTVIGQILYASAGALLGYFVTGANAYAEYKAEQERIRLRLQVAEEKIQEIQSRQRQAEQVAVSLAEQINQKLETLLVKVAVLEQQARTGK